MKTVLIKDINDCVARSNSYILVVFLDPSIALGTIDNSLLLGALPMLGF